MLTSMMLMTATALAAPPVTTQWTFDDPAEAKAWVPNSHLSEVRVQDGVLSAKATDWDPFLVCKGIEIRATPYQYVVIRLRATEAGEGQLFWSGVTTGKYQGFAEEKSNRFTVRGTGKWEEIAIFPCWQAERVIRQLRLDVYEGPRFEIDRIEIRTWDADRQPQKNVYAWKDVDLARWRVHPGTDLYLAPPIQSNVSDRGWVTLRIRSDEDAPAAVVWSGAGIRGLQSKGFSLKGGSEAKHYNVQLEGIRNWRLTVVAFGLRLPSDANVEVESIEICSEPAGPPEIEVRYFGLETGPVRVGQDAGVIAQFGNAGGSASNKAHFALGLPEGVTLVRGPARQALDGLEYDEQALLRWTVRASKPGTFDLRLTAEGEGAPKPTTASLEFLPPVSVPKATYVPEPRRIETTMDVCAYYFPGFPAYSKWECIERVAPIRKPTLGYYEEGNPECVDWQIKWAVENGITCFFVDWYWIKGHKHLEHWFDAYRKARYRDQLKVAIMWANHVPKGTHSVEDWRRVTKEWIEKYFTLPAYYRIDGKPAVLIWSPNNIRRDLGGTEVVKKTFAESKQMAKDAGFGGITYVAVWGHESKKGVELLLNEGYYGATNYHEWGRAPQLVANRRQNRFSDVVKTAREAWAKKVERCGKLVYYPVLDTGWDSRPWHGDRARVIRGRTPALFEDLLRQAKAYCKKIDREFVVLGPLNEWGEGSYIEPNTEFGFKMYEAIRRVFGKGDPKGWPVNLMPRDVGLGPYDVPKPVAQHAWSFDHEIGGWIGMMGVSDPKLADGALRFETLTHDPAIVVSPGNLRARKYTKAVIRMKLTGPLREGDGAQVFFSVGSQTPNESTSFRFPVKTDGETHTYTIDLREVPRWRGRISKLRLDPCSTRGVDVVLDEFRLE